MKAKTDFNFSLEHVNINDTIKHPELILEKWKSSNIMSAFKQYIIDKLPDREGAPSLENLQIKNFIYNSETKNGRFRLAFEINRMFCCSEFTSCNQDYIDFDYSIDNNKLVSQATYFVWSIDN